MDATKHKIFSSRYAYFLTALQYLDLNIFSLRLIMIALKKKKNHQSKILYEARTTIYENADCSMVFVVCRCLQAHLLISHCTHRVSLNEFSSVNR
jgi:hypothetical protein